MQIGEAYLLNHLEYRWDVFISYRRWGEWPRWVIGPFRELFEHWLGEELDWEPRVFIDQRDTEQGSWWDQDLGINLGRSKIVVPLLSRKYFQSDWCRTEFCLMLKREQECGFRSTSDRRKLIMPAIIHDGDAFPPEAIRISGPKLPANIRMAADSPKFEELEDEIQRWVPNVARAITEVPEFNKTWMDVSVDTFEDVFKKKMFEPQHRTIGTNNPSFG